MNISKRLLAISELVNDTGNIMDVGCDHALLDIYLAKVKPKLSIIASDNKLGPMSRAQENVIREKVNVDVKLCDGLDGIESGTDTVIIAGMGGKTIVDIFKRGKNKIQNVKTIILSPHNDFSNVREYVNKLGFYIDSEQLLKEHNKTYLIARFKKGRVRYTKKELFFGPLLVKEKGKLFDEYYKALLEKEKSNLSKIPCKHFILRKRKKDLIKLISKNI